MSGNSAESAPFTFTVDPNYSGKNLPAWFLINTYFQRQTGIPLRFLPHDDFDACRNAVLGGGFDLVYANPFDWVQYVGQGGFQPVAKPRDHFDEVYICSGADSGISSVEMLPEKIRVASASPATLVHMVGLFLLDRAEIDRARLEFTFTGSYQGALKSLLQGQVDVAFIFNEIYDASSRLVRDRLRTVLVSEDAFAFHAFCVGPRLAGQRGQICEILCGMEQDPKGQQLLKDIGFAGFEPVTDEEVECLTALAQEYVTGHEAIDIRATSSLAVDDTAFVVAREEPGVAETN